MTISTLPSTDFQRFTGKKIGLATLVALTYLGLAWFFIGWRADHWQLTLALLMAYFGTPLTRRIFWAFLFFLLYWLLYDMLRVYPNYMVNPVSIEELYNLEKALFGMETPNGRLTPNEYAAAHAHPFLDVLAPSFYLTWVPVPMLFTIYLFFRDKWTMARFTAAFFLINLVGLIIYYLYPAAPPWFVEQYGFEFRPGTPGSAARLLRFDEYFGVDIFKNMYEKNGNVFAAVPSLHSAFPVLLVYYSWQKRWWGLTVPFFIIMLGIWFAAVYTNHHYILDVLAGAITALVSILFLEKILLKTRVYDWLQQYLKLLQS